MPMKFVRWLVNDVDVGDANPLTVPIPADTVIKAVYAAFFTISVQSQPIGVSGIMVEQDDNPLPSADTPFNVEVFGGNVKFTAPLDISWDTVVALKFDHWELNSGRFTGDTNNPLSLTISDNASLKAMYISAQPQRHSRPRMLIGPFGLWTFPLISLFPPLKERILAILP